LLQSQINPHFLYNTLEAINLKSIRYGVYDVSAMIRTLAEMFRYSVGQGSAMVPLQKEIDHVRNYIAIHNMRIGHVVDLAIQVPEPLLQASVLRFSLQPIVENSIKYAFAGYTEGARIQIAARSDEQFLYIEIRDNGIGMDEERLDEVLAVLNQQQEVRPFEQTTGIGLRNVHARLRLNFPENPGIPIENAGNCCSNVPASAQVRFIIRKLPGKIVTSPYYAEGVFSVIVMVYVRGVNNEQAKMWFPYSFSLLRLRSP
jgi:two-component system sensor histidine kinase YesM